MHYFSSNYPYTIIALLIEPNIIKSFLIKTFIIYLFIFFFLMFSEN